MANERISKIKSKYFVMDEYGYTDEKLVDTVNMLIDKVNELEGKALEQQPCEDCISRQAVDEYITNLLSGYLYDEERTRLEDLSAFVWELPSVTPKAESEDKE